MMSPTATSARSKLLIGLSLIVFLVTEASAASSDTAAAANTFLWLAVLLLLAKISGLIEKLGQTAVLGELLIGVLLGNLYLLGIDIVEPAKSDGVIAFLAELGVVILLFQIGLESNIATMRKVGVAALLVAAIGVAVPFALGSYLVGPWLLPGLSDNTYLFIGATLTATSVGITARVFRDLNVVKSHEAQIVLGAIVIGNRVAPLASRWMSKIHTGVGMKFSILIAFCLIFAWLAHLLGLAPIVGAFAAGLVLDAVQFRDFAEPELVADIRRAVADGDPETARQVRQTLAHHESHNLQALIEPVGHFLVPLFFVYTGLQVKLDELFNPAILATTLGITIAAIAGKLLSGLAAGPVNKWVVGWGMVPRGEVGLIFAVTGKALGVVSDGVFAVIVAVVILTTLLTPPVLTAVIRRAEKRGK